MIDGKVFNTAIWTTGIIEKFNPQRLKTLLCHLDVKILPISSEKFNIGCYSTIPSNLTDINQPHGQDLLFHRFLLQQNCSSPNLKKEALVIDFVPAYITSCRIYNMSRPAQIQWWVDLDAEINAFTVAGLKGQIVPLDRIFIISTHPRNIPPTMDFPLHFRFRNLLELRYLRSDNHDTQNGRDIFVPYVLDTSYYSLNYEMTLTQRSFFLFANCLPKLNDKLRDWRGKAYNILKAHRLLQSNNAIITRNISKLDFDNALVTSDFCFCLPGDTSSSSTLYKAIFSGCIPVIFVSNKKQLPFQSFIHWSSFSFIVLKDILNYPLRMNLLIVELHTVRNDYDRLSAMKLRLYAVAKCFDWHSTSWPSPFHLSVLEMAKSDSCTSTNKHSKIESSNSNHQIQSKSYDFYCM